MVAEPEIADAPHRHAWSVVDFGIADDRPFVRQRCACGAERTVPAWDRSWTPSVSWRLVADGPLRGRLMRASTDLRAVSDTIRIDAWSDIACPWCFIGKRNLEAGLAAFAADAGAPSVVVEYHSFELDPDAPDDFAGTGDEYLAARKGIDPATVQAMHGRVVQAGAASGVAFDFDRLVPTRTAHAHELTHHAKAQGLQRPMLERLFAAHFVEGRHVGREDDLVALATDVGLDPEAAREALHSGTYRDAVAAEIAQAAAYGIRGVPFYVLDGRYGLSGAQPADVFAAALRQVASERSDVPAGHTVGTEPG